MGFGQNTIIVGLCLSEIMGLISCHLEFYGPSYGHFTIAGQVALTLQSLGHF